MAHKRDPYEAIGNERVTRVASDCFVTPLSPPPSPSPAPPDPPPASELNLVLQAVMLLTDETKGLQRRAEKALSKEPDRSPWWSWPWFGQQPDLDEDHSHSWINSTPVQKEQWHPTRDAFERL